MQFNLAHMLKVLTPQFEYPRGFYEGTRKFSNKRRILKLFLFAKKPKFHLLVGRNPNFCLFSALKIKICHEKILEFAENACLRRTILRACVYPGRQ
jgi:hypothetical protein